jgi:hypothetical protein
MTVLEAVAIIPEEIKMEIVFDDSACIYERGNPLHIAGFGTMVIEFMIPCESIPNQMSLKIKAMPERK